jgi:hypothetical protein
MNRPIILDQKNVTVIDMFVYLIKLVFYFDTSDLYVTPRRQLGGRTTNTSGFDMYDFFFNDNVMPILSGGANIVNELTLLEGGLGSPSPAASIKSPTLNTASASSNKTKDKPSNTDSASSKKTKDKPSNTDSASSNKTNTKDTKSKELKQKFGNELNKSIKSSGGWVMQKIKAFLFFILFASIYPAVPFFAVMAFVFAIFKWILWKFRKL